MKKFLQVISTKAVSPSRRHFIAGSAAVAGGGLALGLAATWSSLADAQGIVTVGAITQTTFTKEDIELMDRCIDQGWREGWDRSYTSECPSGWLRTTPINLHLGSHVWKFFAAHPDPKHIEIAFDFADLLDFMQHGGRVSDSSAELNENFLSVAAIVDRVRAIWAYANKTGPIYATHIIVVASACTNRWDGDWAHYLYDSLDDLLKDPGYIYIESPIDVGETASVVVWIGEESR